jgi:Zn-dependent protease
MTLNPLAHMDPLGTFLFPLLGMATGFPFIGWAKPVPVDPSKLTRRFTQRTGYAMVACAGPVSNLLQAVVFLAAMLIMVKVVVPVPELQYRVFVRALLAMKVESLNVMQLGTTTTVLLALLGRLVLINLGLAFFNLLPIGPLDGSGILRGLLPWRWLPKFDQVQKYMFPVLIVLALTGVLGYILSPFFGGLFYGIELLARAFLRF